MYHKYWNVLVVDDEPDVLAVTKLALKRLTIYGLPLALHEARSKAEAIEWLTKDPDAKALSMALVDVVMESDRAGLELCEYIRKQSRNVLTRIVLRTGQAGKAPERAVVDQFDISLYLSKTEATEERLYSTVKCCIREWYASSTLAKNTASIRFVSAYTRSLKKFKSRVKEQLTLMSHDAEGRRIPTFQPHFCLLWGEGDDHVGTGFFKDRNQAIEIRDRLLAAPKTALDDAGASIAKASDPVGRSQDDPVDTVMLFLPGLPDGSLPRQCVMFGVTTWPVPKFALEALHAMWLAYRPLYKLAQLGTVLAGC
jgi:CheY-like chemotaxis protein